MFYMNNTLDTETRYDTIKFVEFNMDNIDPLNSFMLLNIRNLPVQGTYTVQNEENRPDMISYRIFKDTQYWWLLMWYNSITNVKDIKTGMILSYFNLSQLEQLYTKASLNQKAV